MAAFALGECYADPSFLAPNDMTMLTRLAGQDVQRDLVGNAQRAWDVQRCAIGREIAYRAVDLAAVELNRCRFENPLPWDRASFVHCINLC